MKKGDIPFFLSCWANEVIFIHTLNQKEEEKKLNDFHPLANMDGDAGLGTNKESNENEVQHGIADFSLCLILSDLFFIFCFQLLNTFCCTPIFVPETRQVITKVYLLSLR